MKLLVTSRGDLDHLPYISSITEFVSIKLKIEQQPNIEAQSLPGQPIIQAVDNTDNRIVTLTVMLPTTQAIQHKFIMNKTKAADFAEAFSRITSISGTIADIDAVFDISAFSEYEVK